MDKPIKCQYCGSNRVAVIEYGFPVDDPETRQKLENEEIVLGGCVEDPIEPDYQCINCNRELWSNQRMVYCIKLVISECALQFKVLSFQINTDLETLVSLFEEENKFPKLLIDNYALLYYYYQRIDWKELDPPNKDTIRAVKLFFYLYDKHSVNHPQSNRYRWFYIYKSGYLPEILSNIKFTFRDYICNEDAESEIDTDEEIFEPHDDYTKKELADILGYDEDDIDDISEDDIWERTGH